MILSDLAEITKTQLMLEDMIQTLCPHNVEKFHKMLKMQTDHIIYHAVNNGLNIEQLEAEIMDECSGTYTQEKFDAKLASRNYRI
jgi:glyceraldehyde-3-phosphate dehydrogenase/erythrose-4-phosphate dehydrogenase